MSALNINELKELAENKNLLGKDYVTANFQPCSYDLRIGAIFRKDEIYSKDFERDGFTNNIDIKPSEIISILTLESVTIPNDCMGTVFAINKQSSTGLLILNSGHIDPGYSGPLSICAINLSREIRTISIGEAIFTLIVQKLNVGLSAEEAYQNRKYGSRKEEEQLFLKTKSKRLSNSVFDLVNSYDGAKAMLAGKLLEKFWEYVRTVARILAVLAAVAGILKLGYDAFPGIMPVFKEEDDSISLDSTLNRQKDSLILKQNIEISNLKDSIGKMNSVK